MIRTLGGWLDAKPLIVNKVASDISAAVPIPSYRFLRAGMGGVMRWEGFVGRQGEALPTPKANNYL